jgi:hypothetical protein
MDEDSKAILIVLTMGLIFGFMLGFLFCTELIEVQLSQETSDNLCKYMLNDSSAYAIDYKDLPSYQRYEYKSGSLICKKVEISEPLYVEVIN